MYENILIPLENSAADGAILTHVKLLGRLTGASLVLLHVADGWAARNYGQLNLAESEEMKVDRTYLEERARGLREEGFSVTTALVTGEPSDAIIKFARENPVDLVAMSTHGHRFLSDLMYGSTVDKVRHLVNVPVLLLKAPRA